jgi:hypothetical protein
VNEEEAVVAIRSYSTWILLGLSALLSAAICHRYSAKSAAGWFPGCIFGLVLGVLHLSSYDLLVALAVASGGAFVLAVTLAQRIATYETFELFVPLSVPQRIRNWSIHAAAGGVAGAVGALIVSVALKCAAGISLDARTEAFEAAVGALCGILFLQNKPALAPEWFWAILSFLIWQVPVGLVLSSNVDLVPLADRSPVFVDHFRVFLAGPTVQLIGLAGSVASIASLLRKGRAAQQANAPDRRHE